MAVAREVAHLLFRSPFLFPMKMGAELKRVLPYVAEVCGAKAAGVAPVSNPYRSRCLDKVFHVSYHSIPKDGLQHYKFLELVVAVAVWLLAYPAAMKLRCIICAALYSFTECTFTYFERGRPCTSFAQFCGSSREKSILYVVFLPLNIWLFEIVEGSK